jgi:hypothetical protein
MDTPDVKFVEPNFDEPGYCPCCNRKVLLPQRWDRKFDGNIFGDRYCCTTETVTACCPCGFEGKFISCYGAPIPWPTRPRLDDGFLNFVNEFRKDVLAVAVDCFKDEKDEVATRLRKIAKEYKAGLAKYGV